MDDESLVVYASQNLLLREKIKEIEISKIF